MLGNDVYVCVLVCRCISCRLPLLHVFVCLFIHIFFVWIRQASSNNNKNEQNQRSKTAKNKSNFIQFLHRSNAACCHQSFQAEKLMVSQHIWMVKFQWTKYDNKAREREKENTTDFIYLMIKWFLAFATNAAGNLCTNNNDQWSCFENGANSRMDGEFIECHHYHEREKKKNNWIAIDKWA